MVDVTEKNVTKRSATARGFVKMKKETLKAILDMRIKKGNVFEVARVAAIMGVKQTSSVIPMCHPLNISGVNIDFSWDEEKSTVEIISTVNLSGRTGVEMEALMGVSIAALTIYDMCKAVDKGMIISGICLLKKSGGKSGDFVREEV